MDSQWLVIVNREHAKIFSVLNGKLEFLHKLENPDGGLRKREFATDRPGMNRGNAIGPHNLHGMTGGKDPTVHLEEVFAGHVATYLTTRLAENEVSNITVAAEPKMCGFLRPALERKAIKTPISWWLKDCGKLSNQKIEKMMSARKLEADISV